MTAVRAMAPKADKITAGAIRAAMRRVFPPPAWTLLFEVRDATGFSAQPRSADAVAMSCWPSRGLELHGFEIKVSRHDWRKELLTPEKAERIGVYCDRWWLVTAPGVVETPTEIPPAWGWVECDGKGWTERKAAERNKSPKPIDRLFLAAVLRNAGAVDTAEIEAELTRREEGREERFQREVKAAAQRELGARNELRRVVEDFEEASGVKLAETWRAGQIGAAVKLVMDAGLASASGHGGVVGLIDSLRKAADRVEKALADLGPLANAPPAVEE